MQWGKVCAREYVRMQVWVARWSGAGGREGCR